ncbi:MAG: hypothetical protein HQL40_13890 [Alphaproteobacteria bacterium]|nr:hypothetical protein [Alphaproteobacteria bacterium]MBF0334715.1 hypothetical protein [Alphaproteobacteria bacterium]
MTAESAPIPAAEPPPAPPEVILLPPPEGYHRARFLTPRELAAWAHERYLEGALTWEEYREVGFPSELHPDYDRTIGALTGERAAPDEKRDVVADWVRRVEFDRRHTPDDAARIGRAERILSLLQTGRAAAA